jgi:hypothetical protein
MNAPIFKKQVILGLKKSDKTLNDIYKVHLPYFDEKWLKNDLKR